MHKIFSYLLKYFHKYFIFFLSIKAGGFLVRYIRWMNKKKGVEQELYKKIILAQTIYVPNKDSLYTQLESIRSLSEYLKVFPCENIIKIGFSGWTFNEDSWSKVESEIYAHFWDTVKIVRFYENKGKSTYINTLVDSLSWLSFHGIFTYDSDILFSPQVPFFFQRLLFWVKKLEERKENMCGILWVNYFWLPANLFLFWEEFLETYFFKTNNGYYQESLYFPSYPIGIAGGAWFLSRSFWEESGWYEYVGTYGPDDGKLLLRAGKLGYSYGILQTIHVYNTNLYHNISYFEEKMHMHNSL